jgi:hypothetical protein
MFWLTPVRRRVEARWSPVLLKIVKVFQEKQPRRLLGVVELGCASRLFPEDVIDVFESLFKHQ